MSWSYKIADKSMAKCREPRKRILPRIKGIVLSHIYSIISVFFSLPLLRDLLRYSLCLVYARDFSSLFYWTALLAYVMVCTCGTR